MCNKNGCFLKFLSDGLKFVPVLAPLKNSCVSVNGINLLHEDTNQLRWM
jgi:hypothetical protein